MLLNYRLKYVWLQIKATECFSIWLVRVSCSFLTFVPTCSRTRHPQDPFWDTHNREISWIHVGMLTFYFFFGKRSFILKVSFLKMFFFWNDRIVNDDPSLTIVNDDPSLMIFNDNPSLTTTLSLTIINEERKPTWKGICTYYWVVFNKINSPHNC